MDNSQVISQDPAFPLTTSLDPTSETDQLFNTEYPIFNTSTDLSNKVLLLKLIAWNLFKHKIISHIKVILKTIKLPYNVYVPNFYSITDLTFLDNFLKEALNAISIVIYTNLQPPKIPNDVSDEILIKKKWYDLASVKIDDIYDNFIPKQFKNIILNQIEKPILSQDISNFDIANSWKPIFQLQNLLYEHSEYYLKNQVDNLKITYFKYLQLGEKEILDKFSVLFSEDDLKETSNLDELIRIFNKPSDNKETINSITFDSYIENIDEFNKFKYKEILSFIQYLIYKKSLDQLISNLDDINKFSHFILNDFIIYIDSQSEQIVESSSEFKRMYKYFLEIIYKPPEYVLEDNIYQKLINFLHDYNNFKIFYTGINLNLDINDETDIIIRTKYKIKTVEEIYKADYELFKIKPLDFIQGKLKDLYFEKRLFVKPQDDYFNSFLIIIKNSQYNETTIEHFKILITYLNDSKIKIIPYTSIQYNERPAEEIKYDITHFTQFLQKLSVNPISNISRSSSISSISNISTSSKYITRNIEYYNAEFIKYRDDPINYILSLKDIYLETEYIKFNQNKEFYLQSIIQKYDKYYKFVMLDINEFINDISLFNFDIKLYIDSNTIIESLLKYMLDLTSKSSYNLDYLFKNFKDYLNSDINIFMKNDINEYIDHLYILKKHEFNNLFIFIDTDKIILDLYENLYNKYGSHFLQLNKENEDKIILSKISKNNLKIVKIKSNLNYYNTIKDHISELTHKLETSDNKNQSEIDLRKTIKDYLIELITEQIKESRVQVSNLEREIQTVKNEKDIILLQRKLDDYIRYRTENDNKQINKINDETNFIKDLLGLNYYIFSEYHNKYLQYQLQLKKIIYKPSVDIENQIKALKLKIEEENAIINSEKSNIDNFDESIISKLEDQIKTEQSIIDAKYKDLDNIKNETIQEFKNLTELNINKIKTLIDNEYNEYIKQELQNELDKINEVIELKEKINNETNLNQKKRLQKEFDKLQKDFTQDYKNSKNTIKKNIEKDFIKLKTKIEADIKRFKKIIFIKEKIRNPESLTIEADYKNQLEQIKNNETRIHYMNILSLKDKITELENSNKDNDYAKKNIKQLEKDFKDEIKILKNYHNDVKNKLITLSNGSYEIYIIYKQIYSIYEKQIIEQNNINKIEIDILQKQKTKLTNILTTKQVDLKKLQIKIEDRLRKQENVEQDIKDLENIKLDIYDLQLKIQECDSDDFKQKIKNLKDNIISNAKLTKTDKSKNIDLIRNEIRNKFQQNKKLLTDILIYKTQIIILKEIFKFKYFMYILVIIFSLRKTNDKINLYNYKSFTISDFIFFTNLTNAKSQENLLKSYDVFYHIDLDSFFTDNFIDKLFPKYITNKIYTITIFQLKILLKYVDVTDQDIIDIKLTLPSVYLTVEQRKFLQLVKFKLIEYDLAQLLLDYLIKFNQYFYNTNNKPNLSNKNPIKQNILLCKSFYSKLVNKSYIKEDISINKKPLLIITKSESPRIENIRFFKILPIIFRNIHDKITSDKISISPVDKSSIEIIRTINDFIIDLENQIAIEHKYNIEIELEIEDVDIILNEFNKELQYYLQTIELELTVKCKDIISKIVNINEDDTFLTLIEKISYIDFTLTTVAKELRPEYFENLNPDLQGVIMKKKPLHNLQGVIIKEKPLYNLKKIRDNLDEELAQIKYNIQKEYSIEEKPILADLKNLLKLLYPLNTIEIPFNQFKIFMTFEQQSEFLANITSKSLSINNKLAYKILGNVRENKFLDFKIILSKLYIYRYNILNKSHETVIQMINKLSIFEIFEQVIDISQIEQSEEIFIEEIFKSMTDEISLIITNYLYNFINKSNLDNDRINKLLSYNNIENFKRDYHQHVERFKIAYNLYISYFTKILDTSQNLNLNIKVTKDFIDFIREQYDKFIILTDDNKDLIEDIQDFYNKTITNFNTDISKIITTYKLTNNEITLLKQYNVTDLEIKNLKEYSTSEDELKIIKQKINDLDIKQNLFVKFTNEKLLNLEKDYKKFISQFNIEFTNFKKFISKNSFKTDIYNLIKKYTELVFGKIPKTNYYSICVKGEYLGLTDFISIIKRHVPHFKDCNTFKPGKLIYMDKLIDYPKNVKKIEKVINPVKKFEFIQKIKVDEKLAKLRKNPMPIDPFYIRRRISSLFDTYYIYSANSDTNIMNSIISEKNIVNNLLNYVKQYENKIKSGVDLSKPVDISINEFIKTSSDFTSFIEKIVFETLGGPYIEYDYRYQDKISLNINYFLYFSKLLCLLKKNELFKWFWNNKYNTKYLFDLFDNCDKKDIPLHLIPELSVNNDNRISDILDSWVEHELIIILGEFFVNISQFQLNFSKSKHVLKESQNNKFIITDGLQIIDIDVLKLEHNNYRFEIRIDKLLAFDTRFYKLGHSLYVNNIHIKTVKHDFFKTSFFFNDNDSNEYIFLVYTDNVYEYNLLTNIEKTINIKNVVDYIVINKTRIYLLSNGKLFINFEQQNEDDNLQLIKNKINYSNEEIQSDVLYICTCNSNLYFIKYNQDLFIYNLETKEFELIKNNVNEIYSDGINIFFQSDNWYILIDKTFKVIERKLPITYNNSILSYNLDNKSLDFNGKSLLENVTYVYNNKAFIIGNNDNNDKNIIYVSRDIMAGYVTNNNLILIY